MARVWEAYKKHQAEKPSATKSDGPVAGSSPKVLEHTEQPLIVSPSSDGYSAVLTAHHDRGGRITEQYRALRTNLLAKYAEERFATVITSAEVGEGKTVTCLNLAFVLAELPERRTVVVDCDIRKTKVAALLRAKNSPGMADLLRSTTTLAEVIQPTAYPNLFLIPAGQAKQDEVGELMGRPELDEIVNELRRQYDYILFDTPPVNTVSDAGMLGGIAGQALLVVRMNKTPRESVDRAIRLLHAANVKIAGIVLSHQEYYIPSYLYRYA